MHVFKHKRRSVQGTYSSTQSLASSGPTDATSRVQASSMGSVGGKAPAEYVDSVITRGSPDTDAKFHRDPEDPISEPLVMDFATLHDGINSTNSPNALSPARTPGSWLTEEDAAAAPPDIAVRRDISHHVPLRTR